MTTALDGGFFLEHSQIKTGHLNHIVRLAFCQSTKKEKMKSNVSLKRFHLSG